MGTTAGLNRFHEGQIATYGENDGLSNSSIFSFHEDEDGTLWIGTRSGLSVFRNGVFRSLTSKDGFFDGVIYQILEDRQRNLWMSSNRGILRIRRTELDDYLQGRTERLTFTAYGASDGMKTNECYGGNQPAGWRMTDGTLWFPTIRGLAVVDPENIPRDERAPPVLVEGSTADDQPFRNGARLPPGRERIEFQYTGLSLTAAEKVKFKYRLEPLDRSWTEAGTRRTAYYNQLPPGQYTFEVRASSGDGMWSTNGAMIQFHLAPHFYQVSWFYVALAVAIGISGWLLYRLHLKQVRAGFAAVLSERGRLAREIHDTLAQGLTGISLQLESVMETLVPAPEQAVKHLDCARRLVRSSLAEARRSVWDLRSQSLEKADIVSALARMGEELSSGTASHIEVQVVGLRRRLSGIIENNLLRIGQEALTNAIRHAKASAIKIEVAFQDASVELRVRDDGCGFEARTPTADGHFGLLGMEERANQLGGHLQVQSHPSQGTEVSLFVPLVHR